MTPADEKTLVPVGTPFGHGSPDFCRRCGTMTRHRFVVASHEEWHCTQCGGDHYSEACEWTCTDCGATGDGLNRLLTMLARAGLEPEAAVA